MAEKEVDGQKTEENSDGFGGYFETLLDPEGGKDGKKNGGAKRFGQVSKNDDREESGDEVDENPRFDKVAKNWGQGGDESGIAGE